MSSLLGGKKKSKSTTTYKVAPPTPQETALLNQQLELATNQLEAINRLGDFSAEVFTDYLPTLAAEYDRFYQQFDQQTRDSLNYIGQQTQQAPELLSAALQQIQQGAQITPEQEALIRKSADSAIESGLSDISRFRDESLRTLGQETAIGRGLRPEDTPILDVGGRIVNESTRQASQFISGIRSQEANAKLQFPLEAGRYVNDLITGQQTQAASSMNFAEQLRQQAFNNRLNLTTQTGNLVLQGAQVGPAPSTLATLTNSRVATATQNQKGTTSKSPGLIEIAGAAGGLMTGMNSIGLGFA